ncbi:MAG: 2,3,4,5-tetrahydropyridine-2,6-dicarboxylate N-succinyltransferase [Gammaproteobacteria bacterium]|jgi:2,3,4,5-tetrahydropyridine-2-carboxylate N-succinyltransferase
MNLTKLKNTIEQLWDGKKELEQPTAAVIEVLQNLDKGNLRVCEKINASWQTNQWIKKAILLAFKLFPNKLSLNNSYDKIPLKFTSWQPEDFIKANIRVVPGAIVRLGAYLANNTVLMPCFVNIGAFIDENTMIDSGTTIGSCAQIGKKCHISSNAVIGGVLEPLQNNPIIIEDDCFIGMGSMIAEGMIIEQGSVLSMGVKIGASTKIINRQNGQISYGRIPAYSVVIPGNYITENSLVSLNCAVIVKTVDAQTRSKTSINELLRENSPI